jgi:Secretion system C-terminal sorting domain
MFSKKIFLFLLIATTVTLFSTSAFAKKVKFGVNMAGKTITTGVHITGDFQSEAGWFQGDFGIQPMIQSTQDTNLYYLVVDIPAFRAYQYKFMFGELSYETEFVPEVSRVEYLFSDNRWLYVDSTATDTTFVGYIRFEGNAPAGKRAIRLKVDMQQQAVSSEGVYVGVRPNVPPMPPFPPPARMHSFDGAVFEHIEFVDSVAATNLYKFGNGIGFQGVELIPDQTCQQMGQRFVIAASDTIVQTVCYAACTACVTATEKTSNSGIFIAPNPSSDNVQISFSASENIVKNIVLTNTNGAIVRSYQNITTNLSITKDELSAGVYFLQVKTADNAFLGSQKIVFVP